MKLASLVLVLLLDCLHGFCQAPKNVYRHVENYQPDDRLLYDTIVRMDSLFFNAYNTCDVNLETYASFYSDSIEFFHDKGGLMNSKKDIVASTQKYVCGKVTRELDKGSIEVYPISGYGAIEFGLHRFHNRLEPNAKSEFARFVVIWKREGKDWRIMKVVSLH